MKKTPLLNTQLVQHMDVPRMPNVLMLDAGENLDDYVFLRGDLLDALSVNIYFNDIKTSVIDGFDVVTTKLRNHISDTHCHTNDTEKRYWNNKLDKAAYDADMTVIKNRLDYFEDVINNIPHIDVDDFVTKQYLNERLAGLNFLKPRDILGTINGTTFRQGDSITIQGGGQGSTTLAGLTDVNIDSVTNRQALLYDASTGKWVNGTVQGGGGVTPQDLQDYVRKDGLKTINGYSLLGTGNIEISGGSQDLSEYLKKVEVATINGQSLINGGNIEIGGGSEPYVLPVATSSALGGICIGYIETGDKKYAVQLDANNKAYVQVPWQSGGGGGGSYDDSELRGLIEDLRSDLDALQADIVDTVSTTVEELLGEDEWLREHFPLDVLFNMDGWDEFLGAYVQRVGILTEDGDTWTTFM